MNTVDIIVKSATDFYNDLKKDKKWAVSFLGALLFWVYKK